MKYTFNETADFDDDMPFGEFLRKKRRLAQYSQIEFADLLGVDTNTISRWELGNGSPPIDFAKDIIKVLGGELKIINKGKGKYETENYKGVNNTFGGSINCKGRNNTVSRA